MVSFVDAACHPDLRWTTSSAAAGLHVRHMSLAHTFDFASASDSGPDNPSEDIPFNDCYVFASLWERTYLCLLPPSVPGGLGSPLSPLPVRYSRDISTVSVVDQTIHIIYTYGF